MLDDSLREMFSAKVEPAPAAHDLAGLAIRRGRAIRRRQASASALAAAVALVVTVGGVTTLGGWGRVANGRGTAPAAPFEAGPAPIQTPAQPAATRIATAPPATPPRDRSGIGLDLRSGNQLWTVDGRRLALTDVGEVTRVYRVPEGWIYGGHTDVRLLRPDGTSIPLSRGGDRWILSPDGARLAVSSGTLLQVATVGASGLGGPVSTDVPAGTRPVTFHGERVVVSAPPGKGSGFDLLEPGKPHTPAWNTSITAVYGTSGKELAALVLRAGDTRACLAAFEAPPMGPWPARTGACTLGLQPDAVEGRLAPDGRWLAEPTATGLTLIDLDSALAGRVVTVPCAVRTSVPPAWADSSTLVAAEKRGVVRCRVDGSRQVVSLPAGLGEDWQLVPRLGARSNPEPGDMPTADATTSR